jgi:hypothetical protein
LIGPCWSSLIFNLVDQAYDVTPIDRMDGASAKGWIDNALKGCFRERSASKVLSLPTEVVGSDSPESFGSFGLSLDLGINALLYERMPFSGLDPCRFQRQRAERA